MQGKYLKKEQRKSKRKAQFILVVSIILCFALAGILLYSIGHEPKTGNADSMQENVQNPTSDQAQTAEADSTEETLSTEPEDKNLFDLDSNVKVTAIISYTGVFMEDRSDEAVTDVLAIQVTNSGDEYIQTMDITLFSGETEAQFSLSTLFPGETMVVLEKNRMAYSTAPEFECAETSTIALFDEHPGMCQDQLEIQCLDGIINVTNISNEDIAEDILIYYKNYVNGAYYGGITYRLRIEGGLKAGEIKQGSAAHFNPDNSAIVFVTCG